MSEQRTAIFLLHLVQDVNIVRPLVFMATREFGFDALLLVSTKFIARDLFGIWQKELEQLRAETGARLEFFTDEWEAHQHLVGQGLIFAASESHLPNHVTTHSVFRVAPPGFLRVTLQHGFECVGFRHSGEHVRAHGETASFGADIICAWVDQKHLASLAPSQRGKLLVTGPTAVLQQLSAPFERQANAPGIVCENLHSVRLGGAHGGHRAEFVDAFAEFCRGIAGDGREVVLRPHPGGQYVLKNNVALPPNAIIDNSPMYRLDLRRHAYGISAPSSVLVDMLLAGIPTAVWQDREREIDTDAYRGLTGVSTPGEWVAFARAATEDPAPFLELQRNFLAEQAMPLDPSEVFARYSELFRSAARQEVRSTGFVAERERLLFIANGNVPTLQLSFEKPLRSMFARGEIASELLTEPRIREEFALANDKQALDERMHRYLDRYDPSVIIFCRYSGPGYLPILEWARREDVPVIYHIDDDLLAIPSDIGERKFALHNAPERLTAVRDLLQAADLVYASTEKLRARLLDYFPDLRVSTGKIYCSGSVLRTPEVRAARKVGYMASADHAHNLTMILPAIEQLLDRNPHIHFELFGSIPRPAELERFGDRITSAPPINDYARFLIEFAKYEWDVGICPLTPIDFNMMKANTKWVEYTSCGIAVVASRGTVYDESIAGGCGLLAETVDEWLEALELLVNDDAVRLRTVERAQHKLEQEYTLSLLRNQVFDIIAQARAQSCPRENDMHIREVASCPTA